MGLYRLRTVLFFDMCVTCAGDSDKPQNWCCDNKLHHHVSVCFCHHIFVFYFSRKIAAWKAKLFNINLKQFCRKATSNHSLKFLNKQKASVALTTNKTNDHNFNEKKIITFARRSNYTIFHLNCLCTMRNKRFLLFD